MPGMLKTTVSFFCLKLIDYFLKGITCIGVFAVVFLVPHLPGEGC